MGTDSAATGAIFLDASMIESEIGHEIGHEIGVLIRRLDACDNIAEFSVVGKDMQALVHRLVAAAPTEALTRTISSLRDYLTIRVIKLVYREAEQPTLRWCWIALGSEGRQEQTLTSDQDNAIIFESELPPDEVRATLLPIARQINTTLDRCGLPLCPGNIMAGNAKWCLNLHEWRIRFLTWIDESDPEALLNASIFFDLRPLWGDQELAHGLIAWLGTNASANHRFLLLMADNALRRRPPLGFLHDFSLEKTGPFPGTIDLKTNAATLFVDAARIYALSCAIETTTNTFDRIKLAGAMRLIPEAETQMWTRGFEIVQSLRLAHQQRCHMLGIPMHNHLDPETLAPAERRSLLNALRDSRSLQRRLALDFLGGRQL